MKKIIIFTLICFNSMAFSQSQNYDKDLSNELNLKEYVSKQIEEAKLKEMKNKIQSEKEGKNNITPVVIHHYENKNPFELYFIISAIVTSIISLSYLFLSIINFRKNRNEELKENIRNIRAENLTEINKLQDKIIDKKSIRLQQIKIKKQNLKEINDEYISKEAERKYIPIGELQLAYKLKKMKVSN